MTRERHRRLHACPSRGGPRLLYAEAPPRGAAPESSALCQQPAAHNHIHCCLQKHSCASHRTSAAFAPCRRALAQPVSVYSPPTTPAPLIPRGAATLPSSPTTATRTAVTLGGLRRSPNLALVPLLTCLPPASRRRPPTPHLQPLAQQLPHPLSCAARCYTAAAPWTLASPVGGNSSSKHPPPPPIYLPTSTTRTPRCRWVPVGAAKPRALRASRGAPLEPEPRRGGQGEEGGGGGGGALRPP